MTANNATERVETQILYAKQNLALVGLLAESLSQLRFREVDMSIVHHLEQDAWSAVVRICEDGRQTLEAINRPTAGGER